MNRKIKILYIDTTRHFGGSVTSLAYLLWNINRSKWQPFVIAVNRYPFWNTAENKFPIKIIAPYYVSDTLFARKTTMLINKFKNVYIDKGYATFMYVLDFIFGVIPHTIRLIFGTSHINIDLIHLNNSIYKNIGGILLARYMRKPCVVHHRGVEHNSAISRFFAKWVNHHIAISEYIKRNLILMGVEETKITVVPEGIDLCEYNIETAKSSLRNEYGVNDNEVTFGIVGNLVDWKGHLIFLRAAQKVLNTLNNSKAFIIGDGDKKYRAELESFAHSLGISERTYFTGYRRNIPDIMSSLDVVVHSSISPEPFGRVIIEAMAMKRPVVASDAGGPREIIENGVNGVLVKLGDHVALGNSICKILKEPEQYSDMVAAAHKTVEQKFTIEIHARLIERLYEKLCS